MKTEYTVFFYFLNRQVIEPTSQLLLSLFNHYVSAVKQLFIQETY